MSKKSEKRKKSKKEKITIREAIGQRIPVLRRDPWVGSGRMTLYIDERGFVGPWVTIEDSGSDSGAYEPQRLPLHTLDCDERAWEPYKGADRGAS